MKEWLKKNDVLMRMVALIAAIIVWFYVMDTENPVREVEFRNIPVTLRGGEDIYNAYNLSVISGEDTTVKVAVEGKTDQMGKLSRSQIAATADLSHITAPGTYMIAYQVSLPSNQVSVSGRTPTSIKVVVDHIITETVLLQVQVEGEPAENHVYDTAESDATMVTLKGPASQLKKVSYARATLSADGWAQSKTQNINYELIGADGKVITSPYIKKEDPTIRVTLPVKSIRTVPVTVTMVDGGNITADMVEATVSPKTVQIVGESATLEKIDSIKTSKLDLSKVKDGDKIDLTISLPEGIALAAGESNEVVATLEVDEWTTTHLTVKEIKVQDHADSSAKTVHLTPSSLSLLVRARESVMQEISASDITAVVSIDSSWMAHGSSYTVPVIFITNDPKKIQVIGEYTVLVEVT